MERRALDIARELDDPDVIADALLGRILLFSGVALHSASPCAYCASFSNCRTNNRVSTASSHTPSRA